MCTDLRTMIIMMSGFFCSNAGYCISIIQDKLPKTQTSMNYSKIYSHMSKVSVICKWRC